ncbi:Ras-related protein Rap-1 [Vanrija pseudolonga]|uniref:Ras-related protein Rap-1 n=1 Tax=Vanrija pseudolonga TaxID=143232 RepID=A0AAF0Y7I2_9TREE|nr:Ras-related protein Rap-1 [Vanrija pseudolonga]
MRVYRAAVMGSGGVGKSAVTIRFINGEYLEMYDPTNRRQFEVDGTPCLLEILDTAGIDQYLSLNDLFIRDSDGFILVFSLIQKETINEVRGVRESIRRIKNPVHAQTIPMVIIGRDKADLVDEREVAPQTAEALAIESGCPYFETSARDNIGILPAFAEIVRQIRQHGVRKRHMSRHSTTNHGSRKCVIL